MAAIDTTYWTADLAAMIADLPTAAKFGSTEFNCAASELTTEETLVLTGNTSGVAVRIIFPIGAFTVSATFKPQAHISLKFPDITAFTSYEIVSISKTPDSVAYEVVLMADNRT